MLRLFRGVEKELRSRPVHLIALRVSRCAAAAAVIPGQAEGLSPEPMHTTLPSWSGLSRPSTSSLVEGRVQDVDARHKGEHDDLEQRRARGLRALR